MLQSEAHDEVLDAQKSMKLRYDRQHSVAPTLTVGQLVFLQRPPEHTGEPTKTQIKYRGPLVVTKVFPGDTFTIISLIPTKGTKFFTTNAHILSLKPWGVPQCEDLDIDTDSDIESSEELQVHDELTSTYAPPLDNQSVVMEPLQPSLIAPEDSSQLDFQVPPIPSRPATPVEESTGLQEPRRRPQRQKSRPRWMVDYE
jgi:hypothetical protein